MQYHDPPAGPRQGDFQRAGAMQQAVVFEVMRPASHVLTLHYQQSLPTLSQPLTVRSSMNPRHKQAVSTLTTCWTWSIGSTKLKTCY